MTKEEFDQQYGHMSDAEVQAEIARQRRLGDIQMQHANKLEKLATMLKDEGFKTLGEMIAAQGEAVVVQKLNAIRVVVPHLNARAS